MEDGQVVEDDQAEVGDQAQDGQAQDGQAQDGQAEDDQAEDGQAMGEAVGTADEETHGETTTDFARLTICFS